MNKALIVIIAISLAIIFYIASQATDTDADEIIDWFDNCPNNLNPNQANFDGDKFGDVCDIDDDNDGIVDAIDAFPQNSIEWDDFDFDGIGANEDEDDDNDGILDFDDPSPSPIATQLTDYPDLIENCAIMEPGFSRELCYGDFFKLLIEKGESSADVVKLSYFFTKLDAINDCHFLSHGIGYVSFKENPDLTENLMSVPENVCRNGFHHGFLMAFFENLKQEGEDLSDWYKIACDELVDTEHHQPCLHGIGHGLLFYYEGDLSQSVDSCHELSDKPRYSCINGIMMQHTENELTESIPEDISKICSKIELTPDDSQICYTQLGRVLTFKTNYNVGEAMTLCDVIEDVDSKYFCGFGVVTEIQESEISS